MKQPVKAPKGGRRRNQFTAAVRFEATAWLALDPESGARLIVTDYGPGDVAWTVRIPGHGDVTGTSPKPQSARAAARRALAREIALQTRKDSTDAR